MKIDWFDYNQIIKPYVEEMAKKLVSPLSNKISEFPKDIADIFRDKGIVTREKIENFLQLKYSEIDNITALTEYIDRCSMISGILETINKSDYDKWLKNNKSGLVNDYLNDKLAKYNIKYSNHKLLLTPNAYNTQSWPKNLRKSLKEKYLLKPYCDVFKYSLIDDTTRHRLMDSLNVPVCPFCNRQYITSWDDMKNASSSKGIVKSTADLDHFFPKSEFPLFALCLFNFVPSCQVCNSRLKLSSFIGVNGERPVYPYDEGFGANAVFEVMLKTKSNSNYHSLKTDDLRKNYAKDLLEVWLSENTDDLKIILEIDDNDNDNPNRDRLLQCLKQSKKLYHIEEVYQAHKSYVSELLLKKRIYDDGEYLKGLRNVFKDFEFSRFDSDAKDKLYKIIDSNLSITKTQLKVFLYGYNWENGQDITRPLSKLTYDILMLQDT